MKSEAREQRAAEITAYVAGYHDREGLSPTYREIQAALDLSSSSVAGYWVRVAVDLGYLRPPVTVRARSLRVSDKGREAIEGMDIHAHV